MTQLHNHMQEVTMMMPSQVRQGDVLITPCLTKNIDESDIGEMIFDTNQKRSVLAYGEVTGHAHAFYETDHVGVDNTPVVNNVELYSLTNKNKKYAKTTFENVMLLRVTERSFLRHEEHNHIGFAPGDYIVIGQHEFDDGDILRRVAD